MEKNCENCRETEKDTQGSNMCNYWCNKDNGFKDWQPDYQTLEAQLAKANTLIIEQIEQITKERAELERYKEALRLADLQLSEVYGTCPTDLGFLTEDPSWCAEHCIDKIEGCWSRYLLFKAN